MNPYETSLYVAFEEYGNLCYSQGEADESGRRDKALNIRASDAEEAFGKLILAELHRVKIEAMEECIEGIRAQRDRAEGDRRGGYSDAINVVYGLKLAAERAKEAT